MNRLFWKFFLAFWLAMTVFALTGFYSTSAYLEHLRATDESSSIRDKRDDYIGQARDLLAKSGWQALLIWLEAVDEKEAVPFLLLDNRNQDALQRPVSAGLISMLQRKPEDTRQADRIADYRQRYSLHRDDGQVYYLIPDFKAITLERLLTRPRVFVLPLLVALVVSLLVSMMLAGYLTLPIKRLSLASRQLASGNLQHRVVPELGKRRDELTDLAGDFDHMADQLQRLLDSNRQLLSDVSHELRSPLARIQVAIDRIRQPGSQDKAKLVDRIERETGRLDSLIGQLLSLNRLAVSSTGFEMDILELDLLLEELIEDARFEAAEKNCRIDTNGIERVCVHANHELIGSAIENILRNAIRHTPQGSSIVVNMSVAAENIFISIADSGPGVPAPMLEHIFEPFVRVDKARDRKRGGHGLGLAISNRAIHAHGGSVRAENRQQGGLDVRISLPSATCL